VAANLFTNYFNHYAQTGPDLPAAPGLESWPPPGWEHAPPQLVCQFPDSPFPFPARLLILVPRRKRAGGRMNARVVRAGVAGGIAGGMVMAVFSMIMLRLAGSGFWKPLNLIAHTFWRAAPLDGRFSAGALVIGMVVHMMMAMLFGTLIAAAAYRLPAARSLVIAGGMLFAALLWAVMQYGIWRAIDAAAAQAFTPWVFAIAHLLFGMMAAAFAAMWIPDADRPYQPAHASPRERGAPAWPPARLAGPHGGGPRYVLALSGC
jgi:hypothetical protein